MHNKIGQYLQLKTTQSMVMTQSLQQSIKLLQFSSEELREYIVEEINNNPLLQEDERIDENSSGEEESVDDDFEDGSEFFAEEELRYNNVKATDANDSYNYLENIASKEKTLKEHIAEQIYLDIEDHKKRSIAFYLLDYLSEAGYLECDLERVANNLNIKKQRVSEVLATMQNFEPAGIFARNLKECLELQLKERNHYDPQIAILLDNLELLAKGEVEKLRKLCEVSREDLFDMIAEIKSLDPKPGAKYASDVVNYRVPDVFVRKEHDRYVIELNSETLPKLLINRKYYSKIRKTTNEDEQKFLSDRLYTANALIKALDQRAQNILRVATEIVSLQHDFFEKGIMHLKPMTLRDIADRIGLHESTISRVTTAKYMATPLGIFEMKYFFTSKLSTNNDDENRSSETVKFIIKDLIQNESNDKILSDEHIAELLKKQNVTVARRTITKYREAMKIPSSAERKRTKRSQFALSEALI